MKVTLIRCPQGRTGEVVIPKGVKSVEDGAFAYCNKLTKITFLDDEIDPGPESAYEGCLDTLEKNWRTALDWQDTKKPDFHASVNPVYVRGLNVNFHSVLK